jgi:hypothetical protein
VMPPPRLGASGRNQSGNHEKETDRGATEHETGPPNQHKLDQI